MVENEYKCLLTSEQYNTIKKKLQDMFLYKSFIQVNYFYDTNKYELNEDHMTLRVRQKENELQIQLSF